MEKTEKKVILSLDVATKTGWALYRNGSIIKHGTKCFHSDSRIKDFGEWLSEIIEKYQIATIVAENIYREHDRTKDAVFWVLAKMQGVLEFITNKNNIEFTLLNPLQIKNEIIPTTYKHQRKEDKQRMINRIQSLGYKLANDKADDEADAIGILITYLQSRKLKIKYPLEKIGSIER